ncbi:MAG: T9SS type A sorting domain-containing protein [Bacteroidetes bacterium]|nr:T9SS type A sorting domain-containing protein [Bacteroidota bacterium]
MKTPSATSSSGFLSSFTGSPNPFTKETELTYVLNRMTYVTVAIYDELGRMVWGDGKGRSLDAGTHTIDIDGASLPSGTLYARISTGFGEVKTVKLVHQE